MKILKQIAVLIILVMLFSACPTGSGSDTLAAPVFTRPSGTYTGSVMVGITCEAGASIRYSLDNDDPLNDGTIYTGPFELRSSKTVYAIATMAGRANSSVSSVDYTIEGATQLSNPTFNPAPGSYTGSVTVEISSPEDASIHYTLDNTEPSQYAGTEYTGGITLSERTTIKAIAYGNNISSSEVVSATYTVTAASITDGVDQYFWGRWTRMDQGDEWLITDRYVSKNSSMDDVSSSTAQTVNLASGVTLEKDGDNILSVTQGASAYKLIRQREMGSMKGQLLEQQSSSANIRSTGRGLSGIGGINIIITNLNNPSNTDTVTTDVNGEWESDQIIPGEEYLVEPVSEDLPAGYEDLQPAIIQTAEDGEDIGNLILTTERYNFQTEYSMGDNNFLYADGATYFNITLKVTNTGSESNLGTNYVLSGESGLTISGGAPGVVGSMVPDAEKIINIGVRCEEITASWEDKDVSITLTSGDGENHTWEDSVTLRFYKTKTRINLYSTGNDASTYKVVNGYILTPDGRSIDFKTAWDGQLNTGFIELPYYTGFIFAFCGADLNSEAKYSFGVEREPEDKATLDAFYNTGIYEPNNNEISSVTVAMDDVVMSYLHTSDYDFYAINETKTALPVFTTRGTLFSGSPPITTEITCATDGASIYYTDDGSEPTETSTPYTEDTIIVITGTKNLKARAYRTGFEPSAIAEEQYVFPSGISVGLYDRLIPADYFTPVEFVSAYEKWYMIEISQEKSYGFIMNDSSDGDGSSGLDLSATLFNENLASQIFSNIDDSYTISTDRTLSPGTYYLLLSSNTGLASGSASIKLY
ncbi:MAG: chitobiase/beta-hexosaminidase C-terminal domain-containing protein [Spirochaetales bacterium]|nr:chitobiase/beta-hexosaminidase C-terminal domain-containing protein [Spirochaetales bacterium]